MPAGQNHSNFALNTRLSAPRDDTWCKIQVIKRYSTKPEKTKIAFKNDWSNYPKNKPLGKP
jgi:hypothetical protein